MPEEANPKPEAPAAEAQPAAASSKKSLATLGLFGGVMLLEGLVIFFVMRFLGSSPDPTQGVEGMVAPATQRWTESAELQLAKVRVPNTSDSRTTLYTVTLVIRVHYSNADKLKEFLESRKSTIEDALGRIIRSADKQHLAEPGLETLKRQVLFELNSLLGDETLIEQVLIPECMPIPTGF